jgi:hypothetical protein
MPLVLSVAQTASVVGLTICVWWLNVIRTRPRRIVPAVALTLLTVLVLRYAFAQPLESKGPVNETLAVVFCYASMLLGMMAQYAYRQAERQEFTFNPAEFLMPIFASPIVFIPLLTVIGDVNVTGAFATSKLMVYLVAFENGFFWRGFFDARRVGAADQRPALDSRLPASGPEGQWPTTPRVGSRESEA